MSDVVLTDSNFASAFLLPTQYVFVVMAVLVLEAGVGALARLYEEQVGPELRMNLNRTFLENYSVRSRETAAIDQMQKEVSTRAIQRNFLSISQTGLYVYGPFANSNRCRTIASEIKRALEFPIVRKRRSSDISFLIIIFIFLICYIPAQNNTFDGVSCRNALP